MGISMGNTHTTWGTIAYFAGFVYVYRIREPHHTHSPLLFCHFCDYVGGERSFQQPTLEKTSCFQTPCPNS
jgi:hypothetical protein